MIGVMDNHRIYIGDVQPSLNNRCGYQHVYLSVDKVVHDPLQLVLLHLPMGVFHRDIRNQLLDVACYLRYILHPVIDIVYLPLPSAFSLDRFSYHLVVILHDIGLDRHPVVGGFFQHAHIPDSDQAHMKRPRNRRCRQSQYIHIFLQFLNLFLMLDTETLLLIDDQKSQILEFQIVA